MIDFFSTTCHAQSEKAQIPKSRMKRRNIPRTLQILKY